MINANVDYKTKLVIMKEFKEKNDDDIKITTVYKGYNIGIWQQNMRYKYKNGKLHISEELLDEFKKIHVITERKRIPGKSDKEKYQMFVNFRKEFPDTPIREDTVDSKNNPIGMYRTALQHKYNLKELDLSEEQIIELKKLRVLNLNKKEKEKLQMKYNLKVGGLNDIIHEYGTVEEFFKKYKLGIIDRSRYCHIIDKKNGIVISKEEISEAEKQKYLLLIIKAFNNNEIDNPKKFIFKEDIDQVLMSFSNKERYIINSRFGINGENQKILPELAKKFNTTKQTINYIELKLLKKISKQITIYCIDELVDEKEKLEKKLQKLLTLVCQEKYESLLDAYDISKLKLNQRLFNLLKRDGFNNIGELKSASRLRLSLVPYIEPNSLQEIQEAINEFMSKNSILDIINDVNKRKLHLDSLIDAYNKAYDYYINDEKIWDDTEKIPEIQIEEKKIGKNDFKLEEKNEKGKIKESTSIEELQFEPHTYLALMRNGINTIEQLQMLSKSELESFHSIGYIKIKEISIKLSKYEKNKYIKSVLERKKKEKLEKQESLSFLDELVKEQENKTKNLEDILKVKEEI